MAEDLPVAIVLRLRANANALDRSAARNERALKTSHPGAPAPAAAEPNEEFDEAAVLASVAAAQNRAAAARGHMQAAEPPATPAPVPAPARVAVPTTSPEQRNRAMWAAAMADVAAECAADMANLPPVQRAEATLRA